MAVLTYNCLAPVAVKIKTTNKCTDKAIIIEKWDSLSIEYINEWTNDIPKILQNCIGAGRQMTSY